MRRAPRLLLLWVAVMAGALVGIEAAPAVARSPSSVPKLTTLWTDRLAGPGTGPVVAARQVFVTAVRSKVPAHLKGAVGDLYAFSSTCPPAPASCGKDLLWTHGFASPDTSVPTELTPVAVGGGDVYVGLVGGGADFYGGTEQAFATATGAALFSAGQGGTSTPVVANGTVYYDFVLRCCTDLVSLTGTEALDATTGAPLFDADGGTPTSAPAVADGGLFVGASTVLEAFDAAGNTDCVAQPPSVEQALGFPYLCSPLWTADTGGTISATPVIAGGEVYVGASNGVLYAFPATGCGLCATPDWTATTGGEITSSVAVTDTTVFVSSTDGTLSAYPLGGCGSSTCSPEWTAIVGGSLSAPTVDGSLVFVASTDHRLDGFATAGCGATTCRASWHADVGAPVTTAPGVNGDLVFVTTTHRTLRAYRVP
jgi:hypothetical protein